MDVGIPMLPYFPSRPGQRKALLHFTYEISVTVSRHAVKTQIRFTSFSSGQRTQSNDTHT